jgi:anti-sigma-K factor RskA
MTPNDMDAMSDDARDPEVESLLRAALTPQEQRDATRARLLMRAKVQRPEAEAVIPARVSRVGIATIGLGLALAASLVLLVRSNADRAEIQKNFAAADAERNTRLDSLRSALVSRDQFVASLTGPKVTVVGLTSGATKTPRALMFWDKATNRWTFIAHNMPALGAGRTYQLWLVTAGRKISAGTFSITAGGDALVQATYALDPNALKAVAVTEEPAGGVPQPTGAMVVVGTAGAQ